MTYKIVPAISEREIDDLAKRVLARALGESIDAIEPHSETALGDIGWAITDYAYKNCKGPRARRIELRAVELLEQLWLTVREITLDDIDDDTVGAPTASLLDG